MLKTGNVARIVIGKSVDGVCKLYREAGRDLVEVVGSGGKDGEHYER